MVWILFVFFFLRRGGVEQVRMVRPCLVTDPHFAVYLLVPSLTACSLVGMLTSVSSMTRHHFVCCFDMLFMSVTVWCLSVNVHDFRLADVGGDIVDAGLAHLLHDVIQRRAERVRLYQV